MEQASALTLLDGATAARRISAACERVGSLLPYLRANADRPERLATPGQEPEEGMWIACGDFVHDASWVEAVVGVTGRRLGTDDPVVATSLFVQNYSYRILAVAIACATSSGVVPDSTATSMAFTINAARPSVLSYVTTAALATTDESLEPAALIEDRNAISSLLDYLVATCVQEHIQVLVDSARQRTRIGSRLLWGNVASSASVAFRTMEGCLGPWVRQLGEQFFRVCPDELKGLGSFLSLEHAGRRGWYWERTNCCLYDRLPGNIRCADCSRTPADERRRAYLATLEEP